MIQRWIPKIEGNGLKPIEVVPAHRDGDSDQVLSYRWRHLDSFRWQGVMKSQVLDAYFQKAEGSQQPVPSGTVASAA